MPRNRQAASSVSSPSLRVPALPWVFHSHCDSRDPAPRDRSASHRRHDLTKKRRLPRNSKRLL